MHYDFPLITHIDDVLPAIEGSPEFVVAERDGFTVLNYNVMMPDTFPAIKVAGGSAKMRELRMLHNKMRRECRGIMFDSNTGKIIRRPFHKFFNLNERDETQVGNVNLSDNHYIMDKLDGSMIAPFYNYGIIRWGTKMGITDVAAPVEMHVQGSPYEDLAKKWIDIGFTPIFEWCSRKQRIVLDYEEDELVLTAIRGMYTGEYIDYEELTVEAARYNIPVVGVIHPTKDLKEFARFVAQEKSIEGYVIDDRGHKIKVKTDEYVMIHKAKEAILQDRNIVEMILENKLDDVEAHLPKEDRERLQAFKIKIQNRISEIADRLFMKTEHNSKSMDRKNFALNVAPKLCDLDRATVFSLWDDNSVTNAYLTVINNVKKKLSNNKNYEVLASTWFEGIRFN